MTAFRLWYSLDEQLIAIKASWHDCLWKMIHVSYGTADACNSGKSTACSTYWKFWPLHSKRIHKETAICCMHFYPVSAGSSSPIWSEVIHPLYSMTVNGSHSAASIRGLPQLLLRQPSRLTFYFVVHHFSGLYMCDIDSPTACVSRGLPTELLFFIPGSQSQYFLLRIIYISQ